MDKESLDQIIDAIRLSVRKAQNEDQMDRIYYIATSVACACEKLDPIYFSQIEFLNQCGIVV